MVILADETQFPNNIVTMISLRSQLLDNDLFVIQRPLRNTDPNQSVGVFASLWAPDQKSVEMRGMQISQPTLSTYNVTIQAFVKDMDEVRGLNVHAVLSRMLRSMLYIDNPLRVALSGLTATLNGETESSCYWGVSQQRFFSNEIGGEWLYLSTLEFWLETEIR